MCDLCRALGNELDTLWHSDANVVYDGLADGSPSIAYAAPDWQLLTGDPKVDSLLSGAKWSGTVTYSFTDSASDYVAGYGAGEPLSGFSSLTSAERQLIDKIVAQIAGFTDLDIQRNDEAGINDSDADIRLARSSDANPTAYTYLPGESLDERGGDIWIGTAYAGYNNPVQGSYSYVTHLHEFGHALGLKHPHDISDGGTALSAANDGLEYSVMSYRSYPGGSTTAGYTNETYGFPQSYMRNDILALQEMYGADFGLNSGDSVYRWNAATGEMSIATDGGQGVGQGAPGANRVFLTIWDGGGNDTYDMSNYSTGVSINLTPGLWSVTSVAQKANLGNGHYAQGNVYNAFQFDGDARSLIENAIGGTGNDTITGNAANNILIGNDGSDRLYGEEGNDWLDGGGWTNVMIGGAGNDRFVIRPGGVFMDYVTDFTAGGNEDQIYLDGYPFLRSFSQVMALAQESESGVSFNFGSSTLSLSNVKLADLTESDFAFSNPEPASTVAPTDITLYPAPLYENVAGALLGRLVVTDPDGETDFAFTLSDSRFEVKHSYTDGTLTLQLKSGVTLDNEVEATIGLDITATDAGGFSFQKHFDFDVLEGPGATINGTAGNDTFDATHAPAGQPFATEDRDTIYGQGGNDTIFGLRGQDYIYGGAGNDVIDGGDHDDFVYGEAGNDTIYGGSGRDDLNGGAGNDSLYGGEGNDILSSDSGIDRLEGGDGDDSLSFYANTFVNDVVLGGAGNDTIVAAGTVTLGGIGADNSIEMWSGAGTIINGTSAANILDFSGFTMISGVTYIDGAAGNDTLIGSILDDDLRGGAGNDSISGGDGNDSLYGGAGVDTIDGGAGNDTIYITGTEASADTIDGGDGVDTIVVTGLANVTLAGFGPGNSIEVWTGNSAALLGTTANNIFDLTGLTSRTGMLYIDAGSGNDSLIGSDLADDLRGGAGNDSITGGDGNDSLNGGSGIDNINAGIGDDTISIAGTEASADTIQGGDGSDAIRTLGTGKVTLAGFDATNSVEAWIGNNTGIVGTGADNILDFSGLTSKTSMGYIDGGSGNDTITGTSYADDLRGGGGNDILAGGAGNDLLNGGKGADTLIFDGNFGNDTIVGFTAGAALGHDVIQFSTAQFADFADVMGHATQVGTSVVIALDGSNSVTLQAMTLVKLVDADFQFV